MQHVLISIIGNEENEVEDKDMVVFRVSKNEQ